MVSIQGSEDSCRPPRAVLHRTRDLVAGCCQFVVPNRASTHQEGGSSRDRDGLADRDDEPSAMVPWFAPR
jgi:hypothetical protein